MQSTQQSAGSVRMDLVQMPRLDAMPAAIVHFAQRRYFVATTLPPERHALYCEDGRRDQRRSRRQLKVHHSIEVLKIGPSKAF